MRYPANVKFMHYRKFNEDGSVSSTGGATIAYTDDDPDPIQFVGAYCRDGSIDGGHSDNFNKKIGRDIACGRLINNPSAVETSLKDNFRDFEAEMDEFFAQTYGYKRYRRTLNKETEQAIKDSHTGNVETHESVDALFDND